MGNRVRRRSGRLVIALIWTFATLALVGIVDRSCFRVEPEGWRRVQSLAAIPPELRFDAIPTYLPDALIWPPKQIIFREKPSPGWWYGLAGNKGGAVNEYPITLWMGQGDLPHPKELEPFTECMDIVRGGTCPPGWHFFSMKLASGQVLNVLSSLDLLQTKRILKAFEIRAH
ncbi:MAG TPA: hypothetical protein DCS07_06085 [Bdellovibrionales bacterium]|nr:MAG: hypothetical protein A2Z97_13110 [Bdellovibrionales bacterium GWB1_52_6]OFZ05771.1 MAG: hypothetical protein A2X97_03660 [Bdellovibrionales bacterium GWA1_52_35]OFZ43699.1 MAG: hypothetical protein A2070_02755 [Bdellovibrionales bacterium GWC1_52_8]HAR42186.1 hypothetical protein [Bdellovibrionales bacterium]HCM40288.1 hypothetical protein [Bdellovibrionales bacterium]